MSLGNPSALYLLLLVPVAMIVFYWRERVRLHRLHVLGTGFGARAKSFTGFAAIGWLGALVCLVVGLAQPRWGVEVVPLATQGIAIVAVLDVSLSMDADDVQPSRLERAKLDLRRVIRDLTGNEFALVVFADSAMLQLPLTTDAQSAELFVQNASTAMFSGQGTNIEAALQIGLSALSNSIAPKRILLLLSDGENQMGSPLMAAGAAKAAGVRVDALGYGTVAGSGIPLRDENGNRVGYKEDRSGAVVHTVLDEHSLQAIATTTNGIFERVESDGRGLERLLETWRTEQSATSGETQMRPREQFPLFIAVALVLMSAERVALMGRRRSAA